MRLPSYELIDQKFVCVKCKKHFNTIQAFSSHKWRSHTSNGKIHKPGLGHSKEPWNKGLTSETSEVIKLSRQKAALSLRGKPGTKHTEEHKKKMSEMMKKRHADGLAWNIGNSRWNNEPSYPEKFFMIVIENEFEDKNYQREMPFFKYSLDFAWVEKKKVIEIDGEQHDRFEDQKLRDIKKNLLLEEHGWSILRIRWKDLFQDTKKWIQIAKEFIQVSSNGKTADC